MSTKNVLFDGSDPSHSTGDGVVKTVYPGAEGEECFYQLCIKERACCGSMPSFRFKKRNHAFICYLLGLMITALFVAIIFPLVMYKMIDSGVNDSVVIDSTSASSYATWQTNTAGSGLNDVQINYLVYYFDLQNPTDVLAGQQPIVVEVGPYAYREFYYKFDISWSDNGDTVTSNSYRYYLFDQANSAPGLTENDQVTLPYPTVLGFQYLLGTLPPELNAAFDYQIEKNLTMVEESYMAEIAQMYSDLNAKGTADAQTMMEELVAFNETMQVFFEGVFSFIDTAPPFTLMFKSLMCKIPSGISPFFKQTPSKAWFGWLQDPLLMEVQALIDQAAPGTPWTSAVPGIAINYTSIDDARRRRNVDTQKTGKKNPNQIGQYVRYQNMTVMHTCVNSMASQNPSDYIEGEEFPTCAKYQYEWDEATAEKMGYALPFETPYSNRIAGNDAQMFGRPLTSSKVQCFVSDIYRSLFLIETATVDYNGVSTKRLEIQNKDLQNATANPETAQYYNFGPSGMLNATQAAGIPTFVSFPNFLNADNRLIEAVKGLSPDVDKHTTYLLVEPQTGALIQGKKRLQVNYLIESYSMPELYEDAPTLAAQMCANVTKFTLAVTKITKKTYDHPNCALFNLVMVPLLTCFTMPSTWKMRDDAIFFPYGWVSEEGGMSDSSVNDIKSSLYDTEDFAAQVQFWSLIVAGILFAMIVALLWYMRTEETQDRKYARLFGEQDNTLDFAFTPNPVEPLLPASSKQQQKTVPPGARESYSFSA